MLFIRKIKNNKNVLLIILGIVICVIYFGIQKIIDNSKFESFDSNLEITETNEDRTISDDETNLVLEGNELENEDIEKNNEENKVDESNAIEESEKEKNKIHVYITGEVNKPGVVVLDEGSRIVDAINLAGGTTSNANISKVNLVYILKDGMKVNIPNNEELKNNSSFEYITLNSGDGGLDGNYDDISDSSEISVDNDASNTNSTSEKNYGIVNINTATQTELETLPGIGPSLALKIIHYRQENGKFSSIDQIKNVSGIGDSKFDSLKKYIKV